MSMRAHLNHLLLLRAAVLVLALVLAFATRLFTVLRYAPVLQEYDPFFNHRSTEFLACRGFNDFLNWFDDRSWYPLGRATGRTVYPGLTATAVFLRNTAALFLPFAPSIHTICILTPPILASATTVLTYFLGKELWDDAVGLIAAALMAVCPGYSSRSVTGFFDNEAIAIFAMLLTFYWFLMAVKTGSPAMGAATAIAYFYMVSGWGGYVYVINLVPLYVVVMLITGRYTVRLYVAYNSMYLLGLALAMQVRVVRYQHVQTGEHMASMGVFFLLQVFYFLDWVKHLLDNDKLFRKFLRITMATSVCMGALVGGIGIASGYITPWTGRFYALLNPNYAKGRSPILSSISEHNPTTWASFWRDFHVLLMFFPAGMYFCFQRITDSTVFLVLYAMTSVYFSGVMIRLILVATPAICIVSAIAISTIVNNLTRLIREDAAHLRSSTEQFDRGAVRSSRKSSNKASAGAALPFQRIAAAAQLLGILYLLSGYTVHSTWVTSAVYSTPSVVWSSTNEDGSRILFDDYREAYLWLRINTPPEAKVMAWWDYGYQISNMANRTVIVDNNTWNSTHIAVVGRAMCSGEEEAYEIIRSLDVDYVLVVSGGGVGYEYDDIDKFMWMVRIAEGVFPDIKEDDYLVDGELRLDEGAAPKMLNSLMYKLCYHRYGELTTDDGKTGYDFARDIEIGKKDIELVHFEEAFTSTYWIVRIYKVKPLHNRR